MNDATPSSKPPALRDTHLQFLDELRKSGLTNMFGAAPYLIEAFGLSKRDAAAVLAYWMQTFGQRRGA